jgi:hypothetical protein
LRISNLKLQEGVTALPYTEFIITPEPVSIRPADQRDARWDVEREGRETKVAAPTGVEQVYTGDFGTSVRHPPRERVY